MRKEEALNILKAHRDDLDKHHVKSIAIFGSVARDEANERSDVDILVVFAQPVDMFEFLDLKRDLEGFFNRPVDLVTERALKRQLRDQILKEAIYAA